MTSHLARVALVVSVLAAVATAVASLAGCFGVGGCGGVGAASTDGGDAGTVTASGAVMFQTLPAGTSEELHVTVTSNDEVDQTITSASITGDDAGVFSVQSAFPITVYAGGTASVDVAFAPNVSGTFSGELELEISEMMPSMVPLSGTATAADAGSDGG